MGRTNVIAKVATSTQTVNIDIINIFTEILRSYFDTLAFHARFDFEKEDWSTHDQVWYGWKVIFIEMISFKFNATQLSNNANEIDLLPMVILPPFSVVLVSWVAML